MEREIRDIIFPFGPGFHPETQQKFGKIPHARAVQALAGGDFLERGGHRRPFLKVIPELMREGGGGRMFVGFATGERLDLLAPKATFVRLGLQVIVHRLFAAVQTHMAPIRDTPVISHNRKAALPLRHCFPKSRN